MTGRVDFSALSEFRKKVEKHLEETSTEKSNATTLTEEVI